MALKSRAMSSFEDADLESSPDPLAGSHNNHSNITHRRSSRQPSTKQTKEPFGPSSANVQRAEASFNTDFMSPSPTKSLILRPGNVGASPWKIKVTVEAEPGSPDENMGYSSLTREPMPRSRTTTIPLKGGDDSSPVKRKGRPRKSDGPATGKRNATPTRRRSATPAARRRRESTQEEIVVDTSAADVAAPPKRGRGRRRKSVVHPDSDAADLDDDLYVDGAAQPKKGRRKSKKSTQKDMDIPAQPIAAALAYDTIEADPPQVMDADDLLGAPDVPEPYGDSVREGSEKGSPGLVQTTATPTSDEVNQPQTSKSTWHGFPKLTPLHQKYKFDEPGPAETPELTRKLRNRVPTPGEAGDRVKKHPIHPPPSFGENDQLQIKSVRGRKGTPAKPAARTEQQSSPQNVDSSEVYDQIHVDTSKASGPIPKQTPKASQGVSNKELSSPLSSPLSSTELRDLEEAEAAKDEQMWRSMVVDAAKSGESDNGQDNEQSEDDDEFDNNHVDLGDGTTILESEGFSMVSIDSLPSMQGAHSSPVVNQNRDSMINLSGTGNPFSSRSQNLPPSHRKPQPTPLSKIHSTGIGNTPSYMPSSPPIFQARHSTPAIVLSSPILPPPPTAAHFSPKKPSTPRLAKVVKAGIALNGVLEPKQSSSPQRTPEETVQERKSRLDDLFAGFGEGTRRELQAGLRLGEQLARQRSSSARNTPSPAEPSNVKATARSEDDVFDVSMATHTTEYPTPEEKSHYAHQMPQQPDTRPELNYPSLTARLQQSQLISPARSVDEMSWQPEVPTPPSTEESEAEQKANLEKQPNQLDQERSRQDILRNWETEMHHQREAVSREIQAANSSQVVVISGEERSDNEDYSDIWEEEASRSSSHEPSKEPITQQACEKSPQLDDLFANEPIKPRRGKLPKTWRRTSASNFNYSDEAEPEENEPSKVVGDPSTVTEEQKRPSALNKGKEPHVEDVAGEGDDTGLFWRGNPKPALKMEPSARRPENLDLSVLMGSADSPIKEHSLYSAHKHSPFHVPMKNALLRSPLKSSPSKSSPLKHQIASEHDQSINDSQINDRTGLSFIDDTVASDVRQLRMEMAASRPNSQTPTGLGIVREPEQSGLWGISEDEEEEDESDQRIVAAISLTPKRIYAPLVDPRSTKAERTVIHAQVQQIAQRYAGPASESPQPKTYEIAGTITLSPPKLKTVTSKAGTTEPSESLCTGLEVTSPAAPIPTSQEPSTGRLSRFTSGLWASSGSKAEASAKAEHISKTIPASHVDAVPDIASAQKPTSAPKAPASPSPLPLHPALASFDPLPRTEPWTKTHYKALDAIYRLHKRNADTFHPSASRLNAALLSSFPALERRVGARYAVWGYEIGITRSMVVMAAAFCGLLQCTDIEEFEKRVGRRIERGNCGPGKEGEKIGELEVLRRLFTVVVGEVVRRDERRGRAVDRSLPFEIDGVVQEAMHVEE